MDNRTESAASEGTERKNKSRRKVIVDVGTAAGVRTVEQRLSELDALPSLAVARPVLEGTRKVVDPMAPPPEAPAPFVEPKASGHVDRGSTMPEHYGMDRVRAMPRDSEWVFVYWELKGGALDRLRFQLSADIIDNSRWVLRVRTPVRGEGLSGDFMVDIDLRCGKWYLKVAPGTAMIVDLGFVDSNGDFVLVVHGNELATPRPSVSAFMDERWAIQREELEKLLLVTGAETAGEAAPSSLGGVARIQRSELPRAIGLFSGRLLNPPKDND